MGSLGGLTTAATQHACEQQAGAKNGMAGTSKEGCAAAAADSSSSSNMCRRYHSAAQERTSQKSAPPQGTVHVSSSYRMTPARQTRGVKWWEPCVETSSKRHVMFMVCAQHDVIHAGSQLSSQQRTVAEHV